VNASHLEIEKGFCCGPNVFCKAGSYNDAIRDVAFAGKVSMFNDAATVTALCTYSAHRIA
jgi:hypothetical protein